MILKRVHVKNFRSIRSAEVYFGKQTAILGTNGAGKSTILRAIEKFYGQSTSVEPDDFFGKNLTKEVEIALTFHQFNEREYSLFESRVHNGEMTVVRVFEASNARGNGRYYGMTLQCPAFIQVRNAASASAKREEYAKLRQGEPKFKDLPNPKSAEHIEQILLNWEISNPQELNLEKDTGQFFGFTNVGKGALQKATSFVFIPAVRDVSADAVDARGAVVSRLMELVVRSAIQQKVDIQKFQAEASARFRDLTNPENLPELGLLSDNLTRTLQLFYADAGVGLKWKPTEDLTIPLPISDVTLHEDGFEGPVDRKGHGLQRAFIFTLLQHLAQASADHQNVSDLSNNPDQPKTIDSDVSDSTSTLPVISLLPGLILAIEEPELYQHPTKQRHFAKVLTRLSDGSLPGVAAQTQVIFASHSSLFVSIRRFDEIRLARRRRVEGVDCKECHIVNSSLENVARKLDEAEQNTQKINSVEGLIARLRMVNSEISEGFFADGVVLVEGDGDRAALTAIALLHGFDFEEMGMSILSVEGKNNLGKILIMFMELAIPVYVIWDCDIGSYEKLKAGEKKKCIDENRKLQRICGCIEENLEDFVDRVTPTYACFQDKLESYLEQEIGKEKYEELLVEARQKLGMTNRDSVLKSSAAMEFIIRLAIEEGKYCSTLRKIIEAIHQMRFDGHAKAI